MRPHASTLVRLFAIPTLLALHALAPASAQVRKGAESAQDPPFLKRYEGSAIKRHDVREYADVRLVERAVLHADDDARNERNSRAVSGRHVRVMYDGPAGRSAQEVFRNYEAALQSAGFAPVFTCAAASCGDGDGREMRQVVVGRGIFSANSSDVRYGLFRLSRPAGDAWAAVLVQDSAMRPPETFVETVETRPMETGKVAVVDAGSIDASLERDGRVALYAIRFATDQAVPLPESAPQIEQLAGYLRANPPVHVLVVGHTDNAGALDYNRDLSQRRAQAIVKALTERGIAATRLVPVGVGMAAPVASNGEERGRSLNRRVEIVKR